MILTKADTCDEMRAALDDPSVALYYAPADRDYLVPRFEPGEPPAPELEVWQSQGSGWGSCICLTYCPWTGAPLPPDVQEDRIGLIDETFGFEFLPDRNGAAAGLPREYLTEEWWIKRKLFDPDPHDSHNNWPDPRRNPVNLIPDDEPWEPDVDPQLPGMSRWPEKPPHLCRNSEWIWIGPRNMYAYLPYIREYGFRVVDIHRPVDHQPIRIAPVRYCFMCGEKLPSSLRAEWEARVRDEGLEPKLPDSPFDWELPPYLLGDGWWREAGL